MGCFIVNVEPTIIKNTKNTLIKYFIKATLLYNIHYYTNAYINMQYLFLNTIKKVQP
ncbi:hypothetical protein AQ02_2455 [Staphylococcus warneri Lyso 1 2011]|nr:hypothetical protein AQ02_2455 [Staphylococcus warneri Lyso 1 2011]